MMQALVKSGLCALSVLIAGNLFAADAPKGDPKAAKDKVAMCIGCHGIGGYMMTYPNTFRVPKIGGQSEEYIVSALKAYRSGDRLNQSMQGIAKSLSDQDMANLAAYYAVGGEKSKEVGGRLK